MSDIKMLLIVSADGQRSQKVFSKQVFPSARNVFILTTLQRWVDTKCLYLATLQYQIIVKLTQDDELF